MSIKSSDLIAIILKKIGIEREPERTSDQFLSKQELLHIVAYMDKQDIHIDSLKKEVDESRTVKSMMAAMHETLKQELGNGQS